MVRNTALYNDIYYYDLDLEKETRLSRNLRARDPSPSPDGSRLIFVTNGLGKTRLATLKLPGKKCASTEDIIWIGDASDLQFETPRYSPDGKRIIVGVRQGDGYKDIWLLDDQGSKVDELMHDHAVDGGAVWSQDGRSIYFSSDRSGIFNIHEYDLVSKKTFRISNVLGGAFMPSVSPDGKTIAFADYSSRGFDIHEMEKDPETIKTKVGYSDSLFEVKYPEINYEEKPVDFVQSSYDPLPTLLPRLWLPNFGSSEYSGNLGGFFTFGTDAIERQSYTLTAMYGPSKNRTWYDFNYIYDGWYPSLKFRARDIDIAYGGLLEQNTGFIAQKDYVERSRLLETSLVFPLLKLDSQHELGLGYRHNHITGLTPVPPWAGYDGLYPGQGVMASGWVDYFYNNAKKYGYSISPENGRSVELGYERLSKKLGSDFNLKKYSLDWHEYLDLPFDHHVLLVRAYAGKSTGDVIAQRAFQLGGLGPGDMTISVDKNHVYLRGYPANSYRGQKVGLATLEYRFPLSNIENGAGTMPLFFKRLHADVFAEAGNAWDGVYDHRDLKRSEGIDLNMDMTLGYWLPVTAKFGVYKALDGKKKTTAVISFWAELQ